MSVQEISISNNQKKALLKAFKKKKEVIFEDENGDLVVSVDAYEDFLDEITKEPIEEIIGEGVLNYDAEYFVFSA
jgi:hypothetical protein